MFSRSQLVAFAVAAATSVCQGYAVLSARDLPANCDRSYSVIPNDTCDKISAAQNASTYQLALVNEGVIDAACDNLWVGEDICLGITGQDCTATYQVVENDNCQAIASSFGISYATLIANNPNVNGACTNIYPGEVLCVASTVIPYTS